MAITSFRECPYSKDQIGLYLQRISLFSGTQTGGLPEPDLAFLAAIQRHHLSTIPFENLALHYSPDRQISLDPQDVWTKFVIRRRGGYCMEQNMFLNHMLRGLGFLVHSVGSRVRRRVNGIPTGDYAGWSHVVNIVTFEDGVRYMVDVGFGGDGPTKPLRLIDGEITRNMGTQEMHLMYENITSNRDPLQRLWVYKLRNYTEEPWKDCYCFGELEFLAQDYEVMSFHVNGSPESWFTTVVVAVRMILKNDEISGKIMLWGPDIKENTGSSTKLLYACQTENERIEVLETRFGLALNKEEREGILGTASALV